VQLLSGDLITGNQAPAIRPSHGRVAALIACGVASGSGW
jgi:hypothetical protein